MRRNLYTLSTYYTSIGAHVACNTFLYLLLREHKFLIYRNVHPCRLEEGTSYVALPISNQFTNPDHKYGSPKCRIGVSLTFLLSWRNLTITSARMKIFSRNHSLLWSAQWKSCACITYWMILHTTNNESLCRWRYEVRCYRFPTTLHCIGV